MTCSCCGFQTDADRHFDAKKAATELEAYRRGRLEPTARLLRDAIVGASLNNGTLLDIGGGVGALTFELLNRGMSRSVIAEASGAYADAAGEEAARRGCASSVEILRGDVVDLADRLPSADVVTLDRVVCCYPRYEPLLERAARHATLAVALSYPKNRWYVRAVMWFENLNRARKTGFRTFVHSPEDMRRIIERAGFALASRRGTLVWTVDLFVVRSGR